MSQLLQGLICMVIPRETICGGGCTTTVAIGDGDAHPLVMPIPSIPGPLTHLAPLTLQINRPPVKLNLLTCQVRPHAEEKKCFDLVTRECLG